MTYSIYGGFGTYYQIDVGGFSSLDYGNYQISITCSKSIGHQRPLHLHHHPHIVTQMNIVVRIEVNVFHSHGDVTVMMIAIGLSN